jgi:hypothetical protein
MLVHRISPLDTHYRLALYIHRIRVHRSFAGPMIGADARGLLRKIKDRRPSDW